MMACRNLSDGCPFEGKLSDFWRDERAATAIEYALIAASIGGTIAFAVYALGETVNANYYAKIVEATATLVPTTP